MDNEAEADELGDQLSFALEGVLDAIPYALAEMFDHPNLQDALTTLNEAQDAINNVRTYIEARIAKLESTNALTSKG